MSRRFPILIALGLIWFIAPAVPAQPPVRADSGTRQSDALRVFLDCHTMGCDDEFFITDIPFVNFTRDRNDGDVHLLTTALVNGAGGTQYTVHFLGQKRFAGRADTLVTSVPPNTSEDAKRRELGRIFKLGLLRYAAVTPLSSRLRVVYDTPAGTSTTSPAAVKDPWDFWVFRMGVNGNFGGESRSKRSNFSSNLSARRITNDWKISLGANGSYRESNYSFDDGTSSTYIVRAYSGNGRLVKSLDSHWSAGLNAEAGQSDFSNQSFYANGNLSAEYNFFPWSRATDKQFVAIYAAGVSHYRYQKQTIYFLDQESRPQQQFVLAATSKQPWGSLDVQARASQYLHDGSKQNLSISGSTNLRISRGLSLNVYAFGARVRDQLYIAAGSLSREDILTQQRALATSYTYSMFVGLSYTFGSLFNTVVNPRLDNLQGGGNFFFFF